MSKPLFSKPKQPAVIPVFFLTEMWERFGFYMVQSLLVLYMIGPIFGFSDLKSYATLGAFSALSYIMPIIGGYFASRILDYEHAIILGGILLAAGYALLTLEDQSWFYIALAVIAIGNGFFKPNISSYLGCFYDLHDPYREKGYTIFYVGISVGALLATASAGYLVRYIGWHAPYLIASIGLCVGTLIFIFGIALLKRIGKFHRLEAASTERNTLSIILVYLNVIAFILIAYEIIAHSRFANDLMLSIGVIVFTGLIIHAFSYKNKVRNKLLACIFLTLISIIFWALYFQMFFSMSLYIKRDIDRHFFHLLLPTPLFIGIQSVFIIILGPLFAALWQYLARKNKNPSIPTKFMLGVWCMVATFALAYISAKHVGTHDLDSKYYIIGAYFFLTIGELLLSPIGLTMITILTPPRLIGLMMGVWFVALGLGIKLSGVLANQAAIPTTIHTPTKMAMIYGHAFLIYTGLSLVSGIICLLFLPLLKRLIHSSQ